MEFLDQRSRARARPTPIDEARKLIWESIDRSDSRKRPVRSATLLNTDHRGPMEPFHYRDGQLYCEDVPAAELAERFGTPLYVYSQASILGTLEGAADGVRRASIRWSATRSRPTRTWASSR